MRAALIENDIVVNVIEYDPEEEFTPEDSVELVELTDEKIGPGWYRNNGNLLPPRVKSLFASVVEFVANNKDISLLEYVNTYDDAPAEVVFDVNGATATVQLIDGSAKLELVAPSPGPIVVKCDDLTLTLTATEAV